MPLPISTFWPTFEIAKLDDGTKNIALAIWIFKVKELNIAVADGVWQSIHGNMFGKVAVESQVLFPFAQGEPGSRRGILRK